jgi:hypothetical protein
MSSPGEAIETTAGQVTAELARRGIGSDERVIVTIESEQELIPGRRESRVRVIAAGLSDDDIDRLIKQAQREVEPRVGWVSFSTPMPSSAPPSKTNPCRLWLFAGSNSAAFC